MKRYLFVHILPYFVARDEATGKYIIFNNWRTNVVEIFAANVNEAKSLAKLTGIIEDEHYHDILEFVE